MLRRNPKAVSVTYVSVTACPYTLNGREERSPVPDAWLLNTPNDQYVGKSGGTVVKLHTHTHTQKHIYVCRF